MRRDRASAIHAAGDRVPEHGRRILCQVGLHGADGWHIPDTEGGDPAQIYPSMGVARVVARTPALKLTPGHFCKVLLLANPSGQTEATALDGMGNHPHEGPQGRVQVTATYTNSGGSEVVTRAINIVQSGEQYHAQPSGDAGAWIQLRRYMSSHMLPADMSLVANLDAWTNESVTVTIVVAYVGSPRIIDLTVSEWPLGVAADRSVGDWIMPLHAGHNGSDLGQLGGNVPKIRRAAADYGGGGEIVVDAAARQIQEFGPLLLFVTAFSEGTQNVTDTETSERTVTGTTYTNIWTASTTAFSSTFQGWSASSGANGRRVQDSEASVVLRDVDNVIPVKVWIYARMTAGVVTGTYRVQTAPYSWVEVAVTAGTSYAWHSALGHIRVGLGAQDAAPIEIFAKGSTALAVTAWRYVAIEYVNT
jgi:hypothetical protein